MPLAAAEMCVINCALHASSIQKTGRCISERIQGNKLPGKQTNKQKKIMKTKQKPLNQNNKQTKQKPHIHTKKPPKKPM